MSTSAGCAPEAGGKHNELFAGLLAFLTPAESVGHIAYMAWQEQADPLAYKPSPLMKAVATCWQQTALIILVDFVADSCWTLILGQGTDNRGKA